MKETGTNIIITSEKHKLILINVNESTKKTIEFISDDSQCCVRRN